MSTYFFSEGDFIFSFGAFLVTLKFTVFSLISMGFSDLLFLFFQHQKIFLLHALQKLH